MACFKFETENKSDLSEIAFCDRKNRISGSSWNLYFSLFIFGKVEYFHGIPYTVYCFRNLIQKTRLTFKKYRSLFFIQQSAPQRQTVGSNNHYLAYCSRKHIFQIFLSIFILKYSFMSLGGFSKGSLTGQKLLLFTVVICC